MKSKVRFITRKWVPTLGGMETYCVRLCDKLEEHCDLEVIALPGRSKALMPSGPQLCWFGLTTSWKLVTLPAVDVTHVGDVASWPFAFIAKVRNRKGQVVISAHGSDITYASKAGLLPKLYGAYLALGASTVGSAIIVSNSAWLADQVRNYGFENVSVIPLGTDIQHSSVRGTGTHNGSILFAGRMIKSKGLSFFLDEVLPCLPKETIVRVAGAATDHTEALALQHPAVKFLGSLEPPELYDEYAKAMCVVVPSQSSEGFGLVAAEAACAGGVVVASAHSGLMEVCSGGIGFLAQADVPSDWANVIQKIRHWSSKERLMHTQVSTELACQRYNWSVVAKNTFTVYET